VIDPGRQFPFQGSELEGKKGSRVLPDWFDVVDDPTQETYRGRRLFGSYPIDMEGVVPKPLKLVDGGVLSGYMYTRQPVRGHEGSNGRARLPGPFGARMAVYSNLFISARQTVPKDEMKKELLSMLEQSGKPYGIIIRKLDFPAIAPAEEIRKLAEAAGQRSGRAVSLPTLIYRVYPDGREELVRGLRFRAVSARSLRDIIAASDEQTFFDFLHTGNALAQSAGSSFVTTCTVVAPSVLFEDLELEKRTDDWPKLPLVPSPKLTSQR
jgi:TldD protein